MTEYIQSIKNLRAERGISQLNLAQKLGISRASYIAIEQGKRDLTLPEAHKIADTLGVTLKELESGITPNYEKYKQMILEFLRLGGDADGKITKTKLAKLLYLTDFAWYYDHFESMSGMEYRRIKYGPVPDMYFPAIDELFEQGKINISPTDEGAMMIEQTEGAQRDALGAINIKEKALIKKIAEKWKGKRTNEIVDFTHNQLPYKLCSDNEIIPYELITQEDPEYVY